MANIDLKYATIFFKDGYTQTGNAPSTQPSAGATTMSSLTAITGVIATGTYFKIAGDTTQYKVTAHTETLGNTTSITFTPGLAVQPASAAVITFGPNQLEVKIGTGNLTYSEKRKMDYILDRGRLDTVRRADEEPVDVKLDFIWEFLRASTGEPPTVEDVLKQRGNAAAWVTSAADQCEPYALDVYVLYEPACFNVDHEQIVLPDFRWEDLAHDLRAGQVSITGRCNVIEATVSRFTPT